MAINNEFSYSDTTGVRSMDLSGYVPLIQIDDYMIYRRKTDLRLYVSHHISGTTPELHTTSTEDLKRLKTEYIYILINILKQNIDYEDYELKAKITSIYLK